MHGVDAQCTMQGQHQGTQALPLMLQQVGKAEPECKLHTCQASHEDHTDNGVVGAVE